VVFSEESIGGELGPAREGEHAIPLDTLQHADKVQPALPRQRRDHQVAHRRLDLLEPDLQRRLHHGGVEELQHTVAECDAPDGHRPGSVGFRGARRFALPGRARQQAGDHLELAVLGPERRKIGPDDRDGLDPDLPREHAAQAGHDDDTLCP